MIPWKDVASRSHSSGEFIVSHGPLVSRTGNSGTACDEQGYQPLRVGELRDAAPEGSSGSVSTMGHGTQIFKVELWTMADGEYGRWPFGANEPVVFTVNVTAAGHSTSESTSGARSHHFLLNNRECTTAPYWRANCRCFVNQTSKLILLPCYSRKMMVASNRHENLYWFKPEPYIQS